MKKNTRWIIGFDLDGVIIDHTENKLLFAKRLGIPLRPEETPSDIIARVLPHDVHGRLQSFLYDDPHIALSPPLYGGAPEGLRMLKEAGTPYFLISRRKEGTNFAIDLLKKRGLWPFLFNEENIFFVREKKDKDLKAAELGISVYVDDQPSVLAELASVPHKFLFDPLRVHEQHKQYIRTHSWGEFLLSLKAIQSAEIVHP
jgi:hypothetical protein